MTKPIIWFFGSLLGFAMLGAAIVAEEIESRRKKAI